MKDGVESGTGNHLKDQIYFFTSFHWNIFAPSLIKDYNGLQLVVRLVDEVKSIEVCWVEKTEELRRRDHLTWYLILFILFLMDEPAVNSILVDMHAKTNFDSLIVLTRHLERSEQPSSCLLQQLLLLQSHCLWLSNRQTAWKISNSIASKRAMGTCLDQWITLASVIFAMGIPWIDHSLVSVSSS